MNLATSSASGMNTHVQTVTSMWASSETTSSQVLFHLRRVDCACVCVWLFLIAFGTYILSVSDQDRSITSWRWSQTRSTLSGRFTTLGASCITQGIHFPGLACDASWCSTCCEHVKGTRSVSTFTDTHFGFGSGSRRPLHGSTVTGSKSLTVEQRWFTRSTWPVYLIWQHTACTRLPLLTTTLLLSWNFEFELKALCTFRRLIMFYFNGTVWWSCSQAGL